MTFRVLRIVLLNCHYRLHAKMLMSGKSEISSGNCQVGAHGHVRGASCLQD